MNIERLNKEMLKRKETSKTFDFDTYNFSSIGRELTEEELYIVEGS